MRPPVAAAHNLGRTPQRRPRRHPTAAERAAWYQDCWTQFNNKAWDAFRACYADSAESDQVNSGRPPAKGIDAVVAGHKAFTDAFPDVKGTGELILVKGDTIASVSIVLADHGSVPRAGWPLHSRHRQAHRLLQAHLAQTDASGGKVVKEEFYSDSGTMMAQLGLNPAPSRPVATSKLAAPTVVIASGTPAELSNVDLLRAQMAAYNSHDVKGVDAFNSPDFVYHDMTMPADQNAKESLAGTRDMFKAFPDAKLVPLSAWGAGSYVVVAGRFEGTNKGPLAAMGIKKPTEKTVSVRYLEITRWEGGKLKEEWLFYDGMSMARQLGLLRK